jgi:hypothetical protein
LVTGLVNEISGTFSTVTSEGFFEQEQIINPNEIDNKN